MGRFDCLFEPSFGSKFLLKYAPGSFAYKTPKYIKVDVPEVALLHRVCQALALCLSLMPLYFNDAWAFTESPGGVVNAWATQGAMPTNVQFDVANLSAPYCSGGSGGDVGGRADIFLQQLPTCRLLRASEITRKTEGSISFVTAIVERHTTGWRCVDDIDGGRTAQCTADGGAPFQQRNGQCGCALQRTIHPLAMDQMELRFEHAYIVSGEWAGSSALPEGEEEGLWSEVYFGNGTRRRFGAGEVLAMPVASWLAAANLSLDGSNQVTGRRIPYGSP